MHQATRQILPVRDLAIRLLVLLLVGGQLGFAVHQASTVHAECAEHGESFHVEGAQRGDVEMRHAIGATDPAEHHHCAFAVAEQERIEAHASWVLLPPTPVAWPEAGAVIEAGGHRGAALWLVAPKQSPPV